MLKYIKSFIWDPEPELQLEDAYSILKESEFDDNKDQQQQPPVDGPPNKDAEVGQFDTFIKIGRITSTDNGTFIIDDSFSFVSESPNFLQGSQVSYKVFASEGQLKVTEVNLLENDWDTVGETAVKSTWCSRTYVCKVDERKGREITLNPEDIKVNLNEVSSEFIPIVGDWVQLDVKCEVDEYVTDLSGQILEIVKILPMRPQIQEGVVTQWDAAEGAGIIAPNIYFNKDSLSAGYTPNKNDKVVAEIIESTQGRCVFRALKIVPQNLHEVNSSFLTDSTDNDKEYLNKLENVDISDDVYLDFEKLNKRQQFIFTIKNNSKNTILFKKAFFPKDNAQCEITKKIENTEISKGDSLEINCVCNSKNVGNSRELILFYIGEIEIARWVNINVQIQAPENFSSYSFPKSGGKYRNRQETNIIRGQRVAVPPRFIGGQLLDYTVPSKLLNMITESGTSFMEVATLKEALQIMKPCLSTNLSFTNYLDKFHTLLHLDEIQSLLDISNYDQDKACFIKNGEYLMLEIENLSEKRPSIIVGDRVFAQDPFTADASQWEGYVHKVSAKHIFIKFSPVLHDNYKGEDYSIHMVGTRTANRRLHQAVDLAVKNLKSDILFPTKVIPKKPQLHFIYKDYSKSDESLSRKDLLKKLADYRKLSSETNQLKLEWYNTSLNFYQKEAVRNILLGEARPLPYIIFGPPGTGKTVTLVETILQILRMIPSSRLLVAAPSNSASDLLALRLISSGVVKPGDLVRLVSNTYVSSNNIPPILVPYCTTGDTSREGTSSKTPTILENGLTLGSSSAVIGRHRITVSTCCSAGLLYQMGFPKGHFTHILVDEAGQGMEPEVMIPLVFLDTNVGQAILAGDPLQLGPVVMSRISSECGLQESYLERLINRFPYVRDAQGFPETGGFDPRLVTKLLYNYRSLPPLLNLTSSLFYNDDLIPTLSMTDSEEGELLKRLKEMLPLTVSRELPAIVFHGVNGQNFQTADSPSWYNPSEAGQIFYYVNELYRLGCKAEDIGIISPYVKQTKEIRSILTEAEFDIPKIGTVEEFQGQEYNVVLLSTVRSNQHYINSDIKHSLGFISSPRRLNVAISRAKSLLIIVGNPTLLYCDKYWQAVIDYCFKKGAYTGCSLT